MEQPVSPERKQNLIKTLAVAGLLGLTVVIAWLAIQLVQVLPAALSSLASLAGSVYNYNPLATRELALTKNDAAINLREPFTITWESPDISGSFIFSYTCIPGVALDLETSAQRFTDLRCGEKYDLGTSTWLTLTARESESRFLDIPYTISFYRPQSDNPALQAEAALTIFNETYGLVAPATTTAQLPEEEPAPAPLPPVEPSPTATSTTITTPAVTATTTTIAPKATSTVPATTTPPATPKPASRPTPPAAPSYTYTYTYDIPVSQPTGTTDLVVNLQSVGRLDRTGNFSETGVLTDETANSLRFSVQNLGTRTSETWSYTVALPGGGTYEATKQAPLKPNERATLTVTFPLETTNYVERYSITITTERDTNAYNNRIESVLLVNQ